MTKNVDKMRSCGALSRYFYIAISDGKHCHAGRLWKVAYKEAKCPWARRAWKQGRHEQDRCREQRGRR